jgi:uncharacterized integral membrane protein (TIGR00698 family)
MSESPPKPATKPATPPAPTRGDPTNAPIWKKAIFLIALVACATPWVSPPLALGIGCVLALVGVAPFPTQSKAVSRQLIQWCVATLGLLIPLSRLVEVVREGFVLALITIVATFALGVLLARLLRVGREQTTLLCSGTAICGGSAIAAVGSAIQASSSGMAIATGAIFLLNAAGLYLLPIIGHALDLSAAQFGSWAGMAIHDVSSVSGAATSYFKDPAQAAIVTEHAMVVKLSRVIWIVPIALIARAWFMRANAAAASAGDSAGAPAQKPKLPVPWLVVLFVAASVLATLVPAIDAYSKDIRLIARLGFQVALFLIGSGLSIAAIRAVGWRALAMATILWIALAVGSLLVVMQAA